MEFPWRLFLQKIYLIIHHSVIGFCPTDNSQITSRAVYRENLPNVKLDELRKIARNAPTNLDWGDWERLLTLNQFQATRLNCTEKPNSSRLSGEHKDGIYECASCGVNLFDSKAKYNAGYGWPSFYHPIEPNAISHEKDKCQPPPGWIPNLPRVEVHCSRCGAHLGHRFNTNPKPDGYRYFINGIALNFVHIINYFK